MKKIIYIDVPQSPVTTTFKFIRAFIKANSDDEKSLIIRVPIAEGTAPITKAFKNKK